MSKMKNIGSLKYIVLGMLISGVMFVTGTYADGIISASRIGYTDNSSIGASNVQAAIDGTCTKFSNQLATLESSIINKIYPIGSIYISETDSTVAEVQKRFGGKWVAYASGKTLIGSGTGTDSNGKTQTFSVSNNSDNLGEYTHSHKYGPQFGSYWDLFSIESDANAGLLNYSDKTNFTITNDMYGGGGSGNFQYNSGITPSMSYISKNVIYRRVIANSSYENSLQPYITVYMYKRIK